MRDWTDDALSVLASDAPASTRAALANELEAEIARLRSDAIEIANWADSVVAALELQDSDEDAADVIFGLRADNERMREALRPFEAFAVGLQHGTLSIGALDMPRPVIQVCADERALAYLGATDFERAAASLSPSPPQAEGEK